MSSARAMHFVPVTRPFHSPRQRIHHRDEACAAGRNIAPHELRAGTGGKDLCPECEELSRAKNGGAYETVVRQRLIA
jgi:hypothetical protein